MGNETGGPGHGRDEHRPGEVRARLLAVIAAVLVIAFLKWSHAATMPVAFAAFLIALAWPLQERLERKLPRWASFLITMLVLLLVFGLFGGALYWSGELIAGKAPQYQGKLQELHRQADAWARGHGLSLPGGGGSSGEEIARLALKTAYTSGSTILLILALTILGLFEVHDFRRKAERGFRHPEHGAQLVESSQAIAARFQQYLVARTLAAVLQGLTCGLFAWMIGLDLAFVWGLTAFLLNYLPTIGSALAVVPPTLFALLQFGVSGRAAAVFFGMAALQILLGNYVDPLIQGRYLSLSPVVVLVSIVLWSWIWGLGGALLGVPITVGLVIAADHFPQTRWIARLLARKPGEPET